jgi:hypothetical protein
MLYEREERWRGERSGEESGKEEAEEEGERVSFGSLTSRPPSCSCFHPHCSTRPHHPAHLAPSFTRPLLAFSSSPTILITQLPLFPVKHASDALSDLSETSKLPTPPAVLTASRRRSFNSSRSGLNGSHSKGNEKRRRRSDDTTERAG